MNVIDEELKHLIIDNFCSGNNNTFEHYTGNISYWLNKDVFSLKRNKVHYFTCENGSFEITKDGFIYWKSGNWLDGIFYGNFLGGTWYNGTFKFGLFKNAIWKNGIFENGDFVNSLWLGGSWKSGNFKDSKSNNNNYGLKI